MSCSVRNMQEMLHVPTSLFSRLKKKKKHIFVFSEESFRSAVFCTTSHRTIAQWKFPDSNLVTVLSSTFKDGKIMLS